MGSFGAHILSGTLFLLVGVWDICSSVVRYASSPKTFKVKAWNPIPGVDGSLKYLEIYFVLIGTFIDLCVELLFGTRLRFFVGGILNSTYLNNFEHSGIILMFIIFAVVTLLSDTTRYLRLPEGVILLILGTAFSTEYILIYFHSATHKGLEGYYHHLLSFLMILCILSSIAGILLPTSFPVDLCKNIAITLQGVWFYQIAFVLYGPMLPSGCSLEDNNVVACHSNECEVRGELLANFQLFVVVIVVHAGTIASFGFAASRYGNSEELAPISEEEH